MSFERKIKAGLYSKVHHFSIGKQSEERQINFERTFFDRMTYPASHCSSLMPQTTTTSL